MTNKTTYDHLRKMVIKMVDQWKSSDYAEVKKIHNVLINSGVLLETDWVQRTVYPEQDWDFGSEIIGNEEIFNHVVDIIQDRLNTSNHTIAVSCYALYSLGITASDIVDAISDSPNPRVSADRVTSLAENSEMITFFCL